MDKAKRSRYNKDWVVTSYKIRMERAQNHCEKCGIENGLYIRRFNNGTYRTATPAEMADVEYMCKVMNTKRHVAVRKAGLKMIVLSVAHINHIETDDRPENLLCACQRCHLKHDRADNWMRRKGLRVTRQPEAPELPFDVYMRYVNGK